MTFMNECLADLRKLIIEENKASAGLLPEVANFMEYRDESLRALSRKSSILKKKIEELQVLATDELAL